MAGQFGSKGGANQSQQTIGNVTIRFSEHHLPQSKPENRFAPVAVRRVNGHSKVPRRVYDEFIIVDREKEAATARWVLNVIAAYEEYQKGLKTKKNHSQSKIKQFHSRKISKVQPIEVCFFC
jgi:hypothetical protein